MDRRSHALRDGNGTLWIIDPIEVDGIHEEIAALDAPVAGVVVLLNRHLRDSGTFAQRYGVHTYVPLGMAGRTGVPAGAVEFNTELPSGPCTVVPVRDNGRLWAERALWWPEHDLLVIAEALGSADLYLEGTDASLAVHPLLRMLPPRGPFASATPKTLLVGHGPAITMDAPGAIKRALAESRTHAPRFALGAVKSLVGSVMHGSND